VYLVRRLRRGNDTRLMCVKCPQRHLRVGILLGCSLLQPLYRFIFIDRYTVTIAISQSEIILSRGIVFTSRSRDPLGSGCAPLWDPTPDLVRHSHLECSRIMQRRITHQVAPDYPEAARRAGVQGTVLLDAVVSVEGAVTQLNVINGPEALSPAAIDAVRWWRYEPYIVNGERDTVETTISLKFRLPN